MNKQYLLLKVKKAQDNYKRELAKLYNEALSESRLENRSRSVLELSRSPDRKINDLNQ